MYDTGKFLIECPVGEMGSAALFVQRSTGILKLVTSMPVLTHPGEFG